MTGASIYVGRDHIDKRMEDKLLASIPDYRQVVCLPVTFAFEVFEYFRKFCQPCLGYDPFQKPCNSTLDPIQITYYSLLLKQLVFYKN